jgi:3-oxoacyl-[acyl-carrier protein] reductase
MDQQLNGKTVLITGGSRGIGLASAKAFAGEGCRLIIVGRDIESLRSAQAALASFGDVTIHVCDASQEPARLALAERFPDIDILINNAGSIPGGSLLDLSMSQWQQSWQLKVFGYIHLTQLYLQRMMERRSGTIVNIIGDLGRAPRWDYICGSTANAGLIAFTEAVGARSPDWNVRVFGINPTATATERIKTVARARAKSLYQDESRWDEVLSNRPFGRLSSPEEVGRFVALLSSPSAGYLSGTVVDFDGGSSRSSSS